MLYSAILLALSNAQTTLLDLQNKCPSSAINTWSELDVNTWYWGNDWPEFLANGTNQFGQSGTPPNGGIHPVGFRLYTLPIYQEPPICMIVEDSRNKKVEILIESEVENANLCVTDASYDGVATNDVGSVKICGSGKVYACFTAATTESNDDFGFYVSCEEGCEDGDVDIWMRVRHSQYNWNRGKTGVADDLEHWCEGEKATTIPGSDPNDGDAPKYYTYPSDLVPDNPSQFPFHIQQINGRNAGGRAGPQHFLVVSLLAFTGLAYLLA